MLITQDSCSLWSRAKLLIILNYISIFPSPLYFPQRLSLAMQDSMALANEAANEVVSGIRVVRSFNTEKHETRRYDNCLMDTHKLSIRQSTVRAVYLLARRVRSYFFLCVSQRSLCITVLTPCNVCVSTADRAGHAGLCVILRSAFHSERTDDHREPRFLHPVPVKSWRQHQGIP